jgi:hypothetical protein
MKVYRPTTKEEFLHPIMSQILPLIAFQGNKGIVAGTAVLVGQSLAITAQHVMKFIYDQFNIEPSNDKKIVLDIYLLQCGRGCIWYVSQQSWWIGTDIALLRLHPRNEEAKKSITKCLPISIDPPVKDSEITALGYPASTMSIQRNDLEATEIKLNLTPTVAIGRVIEIYRSKRDLSMLRFPCFTVDARFTSGMSGGAVFNEKRELCGLVCSGLDEDENKVEEGYCYSNAVSIWPSMIIKIKFASNEYLPLGIESEKQYTLLDLARLGILDVRGHERIEFFKHENGSDGVRRRWY